MHNPKRGAELEVYRELEASPLPGVAAYSATAAPHNRLAAEWTGCREATPRAGRCAGSGGCGKPEFLGLRWRFARRGTSGQRASTA